MKYWHDDKTKKNIIDRILSNPGIKKKEGFTKHVINLIEKINGQIKHQEDKNNFN